MARTDFFGCQKEELEEGRGEEMRNKGLEKPPIGISYTPSPSIGHCWKYLLLFIPEENFLYFFFFKFASKLWVAEWLVPVEERGK